MKIPIISRFDIGISQRQRKRVNSMAEVIRREHPQLGKPNDIFRHHVVTAAITNEPSLHLDDFSEIPVIGGIDSSGFLQQRARLRAAEGDWIVQSCEIPAGFSDYFEYKLGMGRVRWLFPSTVPHSTRQIAAHCWLDRSLRQHLVRAIRHHGMSYIHPQQSTLYVWELAALLHRASRRPIFVIGPPPALSRWANDKIEFARAASKLLGSRFVPLTDIAYNLATLSEKVQALAETHARIAIKYPHGTGGCGNFLLDTKTLRGQSLKKIREFVQNRLAGIGWPRSGRVLIDVWESPIVSSPSIQTWIPPLGSGDPIMEGLFEQLMLEEKGEFAGSYPRRLPEDLESRILEAGFLLATLFQQLGYVGRCSFDLILVGENLESSRYEFIECNARWGGTSAPMTLMNRLNIQQNGKTYCIRRLQVPGLDRIGFSDLLRDLENDLYDPRTRRGTLVFFNPGRIENQSAIETIGIGRSEEEVRGMFQETVPRRLAELVASDRSTPSTIDEGCSSHRKHGRPAPQNRSLR